MDITVTPGRTAGPPPGRWPFLETVGWGVLVIIVSVISQALMLAAFAFVDLLRRGWVSHLSPQYFVETAVSELKDGGVIFSTVIVSNLLSVVAILLIVLIKGQPFKDYLAWHDVRLRTQSTWMGILVAFMILADLAAELAGVDFGGDSMVKLFQATHPAWLFWIAAVVAAPLFEEVMFRGLLFRGFQASFLGTGGTVVLTAVLWAVMHIQYNLYGMGFIAATGILFGLARARTGSLLVPMALHAALNFSDLLLFTMNGVGSS